MNYESSFECKASNFQEFQKEIMDYIINYLDIYNKEKFFAINVINNIS
jgi:hypothetical protein